MISAEQLLGRMHMAITTLDISGTIIYYELMSPDLLERLNRECLSEKHRAWFKEDINRWVEWKNCHPKEASRFLLNLKKAIAP